MPPMLRWALNRLPINRAEQKRLEKEALDAKGFVSRFERLLAVADQSASGRLTARLSGTLAGRRGMPVTVLRVGAKAKAESDEGDLKKIVQKAAEMSGRAVRSDESPPQKPDVSVRPESGNVTLAVTEEGGKGYDLLLIGMNKMSATNGVFSSAINEMSAGFKGPLALVIAGQQGEEIVKAKGFTILVPFNGTDAARRGAEFAFALSPPKESRVTALHVASRQSARAQTGAAGQRATVNRRTKKAVSLDLTELGARYGYHDVRTAIHTDVTPDAAILAEAKEMGADLIVIGATRRVGDVLSLGETVTNVLQDWKGAIILVVTAPDAAAAPPAT
jgi:nucleotide-binding universal stress UspA family protein